MKYTCGGIIIAICLLSVVFTQSVNANAAILKMPSQSDLELLESTMNLQIHHCELKTDETELKECQTKILEYINLLCLDYGTLESGKCDGAQEYLREKYVS